MEKNNTGTRSELSYSRSQPCFSRDQLILRGTLKKGLLGAALFLSVTFYASSHGKPNVIYILTDQWRSSAFGFAGDPVVKTPNIDKFSEEAVIFSNAVSVYPLCTPYRAALLTGRYPTSTGMFLNDLYLPERELCMAEIYKSAGYKTAFYGKWHLDGHGRFNFVQPYRRQGFDYWKANECSHEYNHDPYFDNEDTGIKYWPEYSPFAIEKDVEVYLEKLAREKDPFLLFISFGTPHFPHPTAPAEYKSMYPPSDLVLRENVIPDKYPAIREELQGYYAHCTATDKVIGDLLNKLKMLNLFDHSIIIFTSDHGEMMGSHGVRPKEKSVAWDESIKVPFLIRYPGIGNNAGKQVFTPIGTPDILPTMLALSGIGIPQCIEGEDLSVMVRDTRKQKDRAALFMSVYPTATTQFTEYRGIKTTKYTYVKTPEKATMLFDHVADPLQMNNLVEKPESKSLQQKMDRLLHHKLKAIGDEDFKYKQYYADKWGYDFSGGRSVPYNVTPGKINIVYTPHEKQEK